MRGTATETARQFRSAWARVDLSRLDENYRALRALSGVPIMPVVKADAYGHGARVVARRLEAAGAPLLAVALPEEGAALRAAGVRIPIVILGPSEEGQIGLLRERDLTPVVSTPAGVRLALGAARSDGPSLAVHLKLDTGMTRLGLTAGDACEAARRIARTPGLALDGLLTHLACADEDVATTEAQLDAFDRFIADLAGLGIRPRWIHAASSAALGRVRTTHTLARPGLLVYGVRPRPLAPQVEVRPVMSLTARVAVVKGVPAGTRVSYGGRWVAQQPARIATLPVGYADGVPRTDLMRQQGQVSLRGRRVSVAGTVCMDFTMLDVTDVADAAEGDEAVIFGDAPSAWELADWAGTNAWQVLTGVGARVPRVYVEAGRLIEVESCFAAAFVHGSE